MIKRRKNNPGYLRRDEQVRLAAANAHNPYLEHRGYPGTHDIELGVRTLEALREGATVELPRYDKSAHAGRGDRSAPGEWVQGRFDLVLLEGWYRLIDVLVCLRAEDPRFVLRWRTQAEDEARASGKPALSPAAIDDSVRRFLPACETWAATVAAGRWSADRQLVFTLGADRAPKQ